MAFGRIPVKPLTAERPPKKPAQQKQQPVPEVKTVPVKPAPRSKGALSMNVQVIAASGIEAADYLCGVYFAATKCLAGSELSMYTSQFATISRLAEVKQELEEAILKPIGREIRRFSPEEGEPLTNCVLTLGQSANQALTLDLECRWTAPGAPSGTAADIAVALINWEEGPEAAARICAAAAGLSCPVVWVVSGFESRAFFWGEDPSDKPKPALRESMLAELGISGKSGDVINCAQIYGGLIFTGRQENGSIAYRTHQKCREYIPVGCHAGILAAVEGVLHTREPEPAVNFLHMMLQPRLNESQGWYIRCGAEGGSKK